MFSSPQINLYTHDVPRLQAFYESLGFKETFRVPRRDDKGTPPIHVEVRLDHFVVGIASVASAREHHGLDPQLDAGRPIEIVLWSDDTDADVARLTAAGAPVLSAPHDWLGSRLRVAWVADVDGNPIQVVQKRQ